MIRATMFRHDAAEGREILRLRVRARLIGQIGRLHDHVRLVIAEAAIDRADDGELVEDGVNSQGSASVAPAIKR